MANTLKIVIRNETDWNLSVTDQPDDLTFFSGQLEPGSHLPPPVLQPGHACDLTVSTPVGSPGPEGFLRYEFVTIKLRVLMSWGNVKAAAPEPSAKDDQEQTATPEPSAMDDKEQTIAPAVQDPFRIEWERLEGGIGQLDPVPVAFTDSKGKELDLTKAQASKQTVTVTYTLRLKGADDEPELLADKAVMARGVARPNSPTKMAVGGAFRTWDAPGITQKRKRLLAAIGSLFPQLYVPIKEKVEGEDPNAHVPYQRMLCWSPKGTSTSCTSVNGMLEEIITKHKTGKWGFDAYLFKEAWIPWGANPAKPLPSVGDIYLMYRDIVSDVPPAQRKIVDGPHLRHCGIILYVPETPNDIWITADGGQKVNVAGDGAFLGKKHWEERIPKQKDAEKQKFWEKTMKGYPAFRPIQGIPSPHLTGGAESKDLADANRMVGWLDLDSPAVKFDEGFDSPPASARKIRQPKNQFSEYDYQFLGAWIDFLRGTRPDELAKWLAHLADPEKTPAPWTPPAQPPDAAV